MIANKTQFFGGLGLMIGFVIVLIIFFSPVFDGKNGLDYLDNLYNSISKNSAYYIPKVKEECEPFKGNSVNVTLTMADETHAQQTAKLFEASGTEAVVAGTKLRVAGDLGMILENCLADADAMYVNDGAKVSGKYGYDEKRAMFNWWKAFNEMEKELKRQKKFKEAKIVALVVKKAVESSYNYYKIAPQKIGDRWGIVIFSLLFYVIYTLWYGFAIMFMFEGWGMKLEH
ncbi:MAG: hypothetical protein PVI20_07755 [Desulfobacteraceae bacterium]|jgi:hypothetical protein